MKDDLTPEKKEELQGQEVPKTQDESTKESEQEEQEESSKTETSGDRMKKIRKMLGFNQTEMAEFLKTSQRKISRIELGQSVDKLTAEFLFREYQIDPNWLRHGVGKPPKLEKIFKEKVSQVGFDPDNTLPMPLDLYDFGLNDIVRVPIYEPQPNAGGGNVVEAQQTRLEELPKMPIARAVYETHFRQYKPDRLGMFRVDGDSMSPTISSGDYVLVVIDGNYRSDGIYVIQFYESLMVKRLQRRINNTLSIISDNPTYSEQVATESDATAFRLIGRVLWISHVIGY